MLITSPSSWASDFRNATWGMLFDEVIALHAGELPADRRIGYVAFSSILADLEVEIFYRFDADEQLVAAGYVIQAEPERSQMALDDYGKLNQLLRKRYPQSEEPRQLFTKQTFAQDPKQWGRALRVGQLSLAWQHEEPRTQISHTLRGNRRALAHVLEYTAILETSQSDALDQL